MSIFGPQQFDLFRPLCSEQSASSPQPVQRPAPVPGTPWKPLGLCVLGSGSGGNCSVVRFDNHVMLIDAGLGPRRTIHKLEQIGTSVPQLAGVCLTHLDQDHFRPAWVRTLIKHRVPVYVHRWHVPDMLAAPGGIDLDRAGLVNTFDAGVFSPMPGVEVESVPLPHDRQGTVGYYVRTPGGTLGYATDLGHVPRQLIDRFVGVDVLAIESNYDPPMQLTSSRPHFLKRRIMGTHGHLSNEQAFEAVRRIADLSPSGQPQHVVLLHRSAQCNAPELVLQVFRQDARIASRVHLTDQRRRTKWFTVAATPPMDAAQMPLGFDDGPAGSADRP